MADLNKSILIGRLAADPTVAPDGLRRDAATIHVVVNSHRRGENSSRVATTDSFRVRLYGQPAQYAATSLIKGSAVVVSGRLKTETWIDRVSQTRRYGVVVVVDDPEGLQRLSSPGALEQAESAVRGTSPASAPVAEEGAVPIEQSDVGSRDFEVAHGLSPIPF